MTMYFVHHNTTTTTIRATTTTTAANAIASINTARSTRAISANKQISLKHDKTRRFHTFRSVPILICCFYLSITCCATISSASSSGASNIQSIPTHPSRMPIQSSGQQDHNPSLTVAAAAAAAAPSPQQDATPQAPSGGEDSVVINEPSLNVAAEGGAAKIKSNHDNLHKLMSEKDLRRTFQVDSHDQVPEYEILKLTVNDDGSHLISPISDLGELTTSTVTTSTSKHTISRQQQQQQQPQQEQYLINSNHDFETTKTSPPPQQLTTGEQQQVAAAADDDDDGAQRLLRHKRSPTSSLNSNPLESYNHHYHEEAGGGHLSIGSISDKKATATSNQQADAKQQWKAPNGARAAAATVPAAGGGENLEQDLDKLIVMNLSTFGKDFKLRLKRNADFQQRIKDMKMFMAETTQDGQLRYTEIKQQHHNHHHQQHKQEPHKRAVDATDEKTAAASAAAADEPRQPSAAVAASPPKEQALSEATKLDKQQVGSSGASNGHHQSQPETPAASGGDKKVDSATGANMWNIGLTYHDEDNLAALLIERDRKTGQLQVDGTIGNDFVIKPMPQATIEALKQKRQQAAASAALEAASRKLPTSTGGIESMASAVDIEREASAKSKAAGASSSSHHSTGAQTQQQQQQQRAGQINDLERAAAHMHDDDPHDDDEMFLDEDEALELAHGQATAGLNQTATTTGKRQQVATNEQQQPRAMSKAASERKWKKYRKLVAQTQVPKLTALASASSAAAAAHADDSNDHHLQSSDFAGRARRQTHEQAAATASVTASNPVRVSHHIVYRQKPSSEASSDEHRHSFMLAPGQQSMEEMAYRFMAQDEPSRRRLGKRSVVSATSGGSPTTATSTNDNMIDASSNGLPTRLSMAAAAAMEDAGDEADFEHDPMGGQFFLEPGTISGGTSRAGYPDWSLVHQHRRPLVAPPPYALNGSSPVDTQDAHNHHHHLLPTNATSGHSRQKRHIHGGLRGRVPVNGLGVGVGGMRAAGSASQVRRKRQAPDTVWPEVLLVVDYDSFLLHGGDSRDVKRYFVSFWNGVDLRYKLLVHPHIRISLAGMIVAKDRDATPYLERNRLRAPNADAVDAAGALTDMGKYLYREDRLPTYDLAVVITKLDMCRRRYEGGRCNRGTAGFAYVGGACVVNKRLEKVNSVAIIEDSGGFSGIIVAAHEVGHLLGCVHDGSPPPSYLGGPGATHCPWEDGFIMSDLRHTERGFRWSQCSVEQFKHFLNGETATCLYNYPHESQMLHRLLPGTMLSLDEQCKRDRGTNACFKDARVCAQLFCFDSASGYCVSYRPAAEGSPCGEGQVCRNGKCVGEIENIIPDYTHQSQTVVARNRPLVAAASSHSVARLADNGLSASSTSTATSTPEATPGVGTATAVAAVNSGAPTITSRMDTFPLAEAPLTPSTGGVHPFGGRYAAASATPTSGTTLRSLPPISASTNPNTHYNQQRSSSLVPAKSAKLSHHQHEQSNYNNNNNYQYHQFQQLTSPLGDDNSWPQQHHNFMNQQQVPSSYQQRSGFQAVSAITTPGNKRYSTAATLAASTGIQASASSLPHHQQPNNQHHNYNHHQHQSYQSTRCHHSSLPCHTAQ